MAVPRGMQMVEAQLMHFRGEHSLHGQVGRTPLLWFQQIIWLCFQTTVPNEWARPLLIASLATLEGNGFLLSLLHQQFSSPPLLVRKQHVLGGVFQGPLFGWCPRPFVAH